jgi:hypothetical protein
MLILRWMPAQIACSGCVRWLNVFVYPSALSALIQQGQLPAGKLNAAVRVPESAVILST